MDMKDNHQISDARRRRQDRESVGKAAHAGSRAMLTLLQSLGNLAAVSNQLAYNPASGRAPFAESDIEQAIQLFFDSILGHESCSKELKKLVAHLHWPFLESTKKNGRFLTDERHPARRLIKALYLETARMDGMDDVSRARCFQKMLDIVKTVENEFNGDERIFLKAYFDLTHLEAES